MPFMEYHAATLMGCSFLRYQLLVMMLNMGRQPASNSPRKKRAAIRLPKSWQAAMAACAMPQPRIKMGTHIRGGTFKMTIELKGCQQSCAIAAKDPTSEYWEPVRLVSVCSPKMAP